MSEKTRAYFSTIANSLPRLRTLNIFGILGVQAPLVVKDSAIRFLNACSPDLERLVLAWETLAYNEVLPDDDGYNGNVQDLPTCRALKFLSATPPTTLLHHSSPFHLALQETTGIRFMELHVPRTNTDDHAIADLISNISRSPDGVPQRWRTIAINGALTCLEFLDLGIDAEYGSREELVDDIDGTIYDPQFQMNCLEMSLASGLGLSGDLQDLRSLRLVGMEHRIGIDWNASAVWIPRAYQREPGVQQWLASQVVAWVLLE
ncbi:hypothetical protein BGW39_006207 [Mortierella sp. 14UC]|nr:hypothetical protein BGW39_006207 [Mortierella sp. 14UC]